MPGDLLFTGMDETSGVFHADSSQFQCWTIWRFHVFLMTRPLVDPWHHPPPVMHGSSHDLQAISATKTSLLERQCCFRLLAHCQMPFFGFFPFLQTMVERWCGWRDETQTATHTTRANGGIHQMWCLFGDQHWSSWHQSCSVIVHLFTSSSGGWSEG